MVSETDETTQTATGEQNKAGENSDAPKVHVRRRQDRAPGGGNDDPPAYQMYPSKTLSDWLAEVGGSIAFSSYQSGRIFFLGRNADGKVRANERNFKRCMGIAVSEDRQRVYLATKQEIFRLDNYLEPGSQWEDGSDALFIPRKTWITGDLDAHDICLDENETPIFVNTLFNCLAETEDGYSFQPVWAPEYITDIVPEDRCHLNGLAMEGHRPRYVSAVATTNHRAGWRDVRADGGVVIDVTTNEVQAEGLSMPHSPRLHEGRLWVLNSGRGELGWIDREARKFVPVALCPGYARGLTFAGPYAIVGLSLPRYNETFSGLPLEDALAEFGIEPYCGLTIIDTRTGKQVAGLKIEGTVREIYDVQFLEGYSKPSVIGFRSKELHQLLSIAAPEEAAAVPKLTRSHFRIAREQRNKGPEETNQPNQ